MKRTERRRVRKTVVTAVICDRCHKTIDADDIFEVQEVVSVAFTGGFSSIFGDGTRLACDLCQHSVRQVLGPFLKESGVAMKRLLERLVKWLTAGAEAHPGDRFITVRSNGTAHFDVSAYLASPEGQAGCEPSPPPRTSAPIELRHRRRADRHSRFANREYFVHARLGAYAKQRACHLLPLNPKKTRPDSGRED